MGAVSGNYYQAVSNNLKNELYGGSRTDFANAGRAGVSARIQQANASNTEKNIAQIQTVAQNMYGLNLDSSSIFAMANTNGDDHITQKEATAFMSKLPQLAQMSSAGGSSSSGGSNAMSILNGLTDAAGNIFGTSNGDGGSSGSGGNIIQKGIDFLGGLFG